MAFKLRDELFHAPLVLLREAAHIVLVFHRHCEPVRNDSAELSYPVVELVGVGSDYHIYIRGQAVVIRSVRIERNQLSVTLRKVVVEVEAVVELLDFGFGELHQIVHTARAAALYQLLSIVAAFRLRVGQRDRAALGDYTPEQALCLRNHRQKRDAASAGGFAEDCDVVGVAAERGDILAYPAESFDLVEDSEVRSVGIILSALNIAQIHEPHQAHSVADCYEHDVRMSGNEI